MNVLGIIATASRIASEEVVVDADGNVVTHSWLLPETAEIIYGGIASLIIFFALYKFGWPQMKKSFEARTARIQKELDDAAADKAAAAAAAVNDPDSATALRAERALVSALDADCHTAVGAMATVSEGEIELSAVVLAPDGRSALRAMVTSTEGAETVGRNLAKQLLDSGADQLLALARGDS